jgi:hypothetical protein
MDHYRYVILKLEKDQYKVIAVGIHKYFDSSVYYKGFIYTKESINFLKVHADYKYIDEAELIKKHYDKLI